MREVVLEVCNTPDEIGKRFRIYRDNGKPLRFPILGGIRAAGVALAVAVGVRLRASRTAARLFSECGLARPERERFWRRCFPAA